MDLPAKGSCAWSSPGAGGSSRRRKANDTRRRWHESSLKLDSMPSYRSKQTPKVHASSLDLDQRRTPLLDAVRRRGDASQESPFHVPGHKRGVGAYEGFTRLVQPPRGSVLQYDLTEISGLDYLSSPTGVIREAQQLAAAAFGADQTWFLVNGCSAGIHAAVVAATAAATSSSLPRAPKSVDMALKALGDVETAAAVATEPLQSSAPRGGTIATTATGTGPAAGSAGGAVGTLVVARNCHLSAFSAMVVAGCEPYWVAPEVDPHFGVAHCVTPGSVREALEDAARRGRRVVGVLIVSPTYFGAVADVAVIAAACHDHGVPLLVDEAHGGHFAFLPHPHPASPSRDAAATPPATDPGRVVSHSSGPARPAGVSTEAEAGGHRRTGGDPGRAAPLPPSALSCGADLVMQSTHKVLGAMTQAAMLHARGPRVSAAHIGRALQTLQSSSPSYLLMASLDAARAQAAAGGAFEEPSAAAQLIREAVAQCRTVRLLDERTAGARQSVLCFDPLRLTLLVDGLGLPGGGFEAAEWLEQRHGVVPELATSKTVVLALGPGSTLGHARAAATAIRELEQEVEARGGVALREPRDPGRETSGTAAAVRGQGEAATAATCTAAEAVKVVLTPREAFFSPVVSVPADEAIGRVSAELLCPYPPGVPVLFPGECITSAALAALRATLAAGGAVTGASDPSLASLAVTAKEGWGRGLGETSRVDESGGSEGTG